MENNYRFYFIVVILCAALPNNSSPMPFRARRERAGSRAVVADLQSFSALPDGNQPVFLQADEDIPDPVFRQIERVSQGSSADGLSHSVGFGNFQEYFAADVIVALIIAGCGTAGGCRLKFFRQHRRGGGIIRANIYQVLYGILQFSDIAGPIIGQKIGGDQAEIVLGRHGLFRGSIIIVKRPG